MARRIEQPVQLVVGGESPPFTHRLVDHLATMLPDTRTTVVPAVSVAEDAAQDSVGALPGFGRDGTEPVRQP